MRCGGWRARAATALVAVALAAGCSDDDGAEPARASVPERTTTTATASVSTTSSTAPTTEFEPLPADPALTPEEQVEAAYLYSWEVYLDALATGRTDALGVAYAEPSLGARRSAIEERAAEGRIVLGDVEHDYDVTVVEPGLALVVDAYANHLVLADQSSGEPLEPDPDEVVAYQYTLELEDNSWLVVFVERV